MAITIKRVGINHEGTLLYLQDTTGYGVDANPARNTVAVIMLGYAKTSSGNISVDINAYLPETAEHFVAQLKHDAVHVFRLFNVVIDNGVIGTEGNITYRIADSKLLKVVDGVQVEIEQHELWGSNVPHGELTTLIVSKSAKAKNKAEKANLEALQNLIGGGCDRGEAKKAQRNYNYIRSLFRGAWIDYCSGEHTLATQKLESLLKFAKN